MLPTLYKTNKNQSIQYCTITTNDDTYTVEFGQLNTDLPQFKTTICVGMNIGRSNATTASEQAISEAESKHAKKIKSGYSTDVSAPETTRTLAMKVKTYADNLKNIDFTHKVYMSPKLDGVNGIFKIEDSHLNLYSRGGELYPMPPHLINPVFKDLASAKTDELNCELCNHSLHLQDITSAVKKHNANTPLIQCHIFDYPNITNIYKDKINTILNSDLSVPEIIEANSHEDIEKYHDECVSAGYEGIVIRNANLVYQHGIRSSNAFKMKIQLDMEVKVINFSIDKNQHPVYLCETLKHEQFKVKRKGTNEERLADAKIAKSNIGKWLNISYEALSKAEIPLKPVGNYFRKVDETTGEAVE